MSRNTIHPLIACVAAFAAVVSASPAVQAQTPVLGPTINISDPDPFAGLMPQWDASYPQYVGAQEETYIVVNPRNANNIAATWNTEVFKGAAVGVSMDGGVTWQTSIVPGRTLASGGTVAFAIDPSLSFAPNGDLYFFGMVWNLTLSPFYGVGVNKSTDGGLHWSGMTMLDSTNDKRLTLEKPFITADPTDARYAYAVWEYHF